MHKRDLHAIRQNLIIDYGHYDKITYVTNTYATTRFPSLYSNYDMKPNLNVIIFDEQDAQSVSSRPTPAKPTPQPYHIIEQELHFLTDKIKQLQTQADSLAFARNDSNLTNKTTNTHPHPSPTHSRELLMTIEKKIQIIVKETRKIVDKLGQNFDKKLENKVAQKYDELGISKIKENYSLTLKKIEENYRREIERINREHRDVENKMVAKMGEIEQKMLNRMNEFDLREKEYVDWIHHLEIQLQQKQSKSKKMIEITQERGSKKDISDNNSTINGDQNYSSIQPKQPNNPTSSNFISSNHITITNPNDNSKVNRKHRIFDNSSKQPSSISPNPKSVSPLNSQPYMTANAPLYSTKVINPIKNKEPEVERPPTVSPAARQEPRSTEIQSSPWKVIDKSIEKSYEIPTRRNEVIKDVNADEFYRDVPKANQGWEKFQDFEENDSSSDSSSEDVLFYREADRQQEFVDNFRSSKFADSKQIKEKDPRELKNIFDSKKPQEPRYEQKVFSPFDLN